MKIYFNWLKTKIIQYPEKILMVLLIGTVCIEGFTIASKLVSYDDSHSRIINLDMSLKMLKPDTPFTKKEFDLLTLKIRKTIPINELHKRNLFSQKTQVITEETSFDLERKDTDNDGLPDDWEILYGFNKNDPSDARQDPDKDGYSNLDEYIGGSDPTDLNSFPGELKLKIIKIYKKRIQIEFLGYIKLPNARFQFQVNWADRTSFLKLGEKIRGYKIVEFQQEFKKHFSKKIDADETFDISKLVIGKQNKDPLTLILGIPSYERELYAVLKDLTDGSTFEAHSGSLIKDYEVLDIESSKVIIMRNQKRYTLSLTKKR